MDPMNDPQIRKWTEASGGQADYLDFLSESIGLPEWIALSRVFLPRFIEVQGCILWERSYDPSNFETWYSSLNGDVTRIEATLNQFRLSLYLEFADDDISRSNALSLAEDIATVWRLQLERTFPRKKFSVSARETEDGPVVGFISAPDETAKLR